MIPCEPELSLEKRIMFQGFGDICEQHQTALPGAGTIEISDKADCTTEVS